MNFSMNLIHQEFSHSNICWKSCFRTYFFCWKRLWFKQSSSKNSMKYEKGRYININRGKSNYLVICTICDIFFSRGRRGFQDFCWGTFTVFQNWEETNISHTRLWHLIIIFYGFWLHLLSFLFSLHHTL